MPYLTDDDINSGILDKFSKQDPDELEKKHKLAWDNAPGYRDLFKDPEQYAPGPIQAKGGVSPERGFVGDVASNLARGAADLTRMGGYALKTIDPDGGLDVVENIGQGLVDMADKSKNLDIMKLDESEAAGENFFSRGWKGGVRSSVPSIAPTFAGAAIGAAFGGPVGALAGGFLGNLGLFGLGVYGEKKQEYLDHGINEEDAHNAALKQGFIEGGIEAVTGVVGLKIFGADKLVSQPLKQSINELLKTPAKEWAKRFSINTLLNEVPTEMVQEALGMQVETGLGLAEEGAWKEAAAEAIIPAITMSLLFGVGSGAMTTVQKRSLKRQLNDMENPQAREKAVEALEKAIVDADNTPEGKENAKAFADMAMDRIDQGETIDINGNFVEFAAMEEEVRQAGAREVEKGRVVEHVAKLETKVKNLSEFQNPTDAQKNRIEQYLQELVQARGVLQQMEETETPEPSTIVETPDSASPETAEQAVPVDVVPSQAVSVEEEQQAEAIPETESLFETEEPQDMADIPKMEDNEVESLYANLDIDNAGGPEITPDDVGNIIGPGIVDEQAPGGIKGSKVIEAQKESTVTPMTDEITTTDTPMTDRVTPMTPGTPVTWKNKKGKEFSGTLNKKHGKNWHITLDSGANSIMPESKLTVVEDQQAGPAEELGKVKKPQDRKVIEERVKQDLLEKAEQNQSRYGDLSLTPLAVDIANDAIETRQRMTKEKREALAKKYGVPENIVHQMTTGGPGYEMLAGQSEIGDKDASVFLDAAGVPQTETEPGPSRDQVGTKSGTTYLNDNTPIEFEYHRVPVESLITSHNDTMDPNPEYPKELQPRDRKRIMSLVQVDKIADNPNPERLAGSTSVAHGAPIAIPRGVDKNGTQRYVIISGNARTMALRKAQTNDKLSAYLKYFDQNADNFGTDTDGVLIRVVDPEKIGDLVSFAQKANETDIAKMSSTEQAIVDAGNLSSDDLAMFRPDQDGNLMAATNKGFIDLFFDKMSPEERSGYITDDGRANKQLIDRVQAAVFQKAYNSDELLKLSAEEANPDIKNILNGLTNGAANFVKARGLDKDLADIGIVNDIVDGIELLRRAKKEYPDIKAGNGRTALQAQLRQTIDQGDLFGGGPSEEVTAIAQFLADNIRSGKRIGEFFDSIGVRLRAYIADLAQAEMFGTKKTLTSKDLIETAKEFLHEKYEDKQQSLFEEQADKRRVPGSETGDTARSDQGRDEDPGRTGASTRQEVTYEEDPTKKGFKVGDRVVLDIDSKKHPFASQDPVEIKSISKNGMLTLKGVPGKERFPEDFKKFEPVDTENKVDYGAKNKVFTKDAADKAREVLRKKLSGNQLNSGIDPEIMLAGIQLAGYHVEAGARTFAEYSKAMVNDVGESVKPYLRSFYEGVRHFPGFDSAGMTESNTLDKGTEAIENETTPAPTPTTEEVNDDQSQESQENDGRPGIQSLGQEDGETIPGGRDGVLAGNVEPETTGSDNTLETSAPEDVRGSEAPGAVEGNGLRPGMQDDGGVGRAEGRRDEQFGREDASGTGLDDNGPGGAERARGTGIPGESDRVLENYHIEDPEALIGGTPKVRFKKNQKAIEVFNEVSNEGSRPTAEERDAMAAYIGWGSFGQELFQGTFENPTYKDGWAKEGEWLRSHLGKSAWESAQRSIRNAHYTDPPTVSAVWDIVKQLGFNGGRVLEPSMGVGNFFGLMPKGLKSNSDLTGIELDETTAGMAKMLYPEANIQQMGYQDSKTADGFYDLVLGNWPFDAQGPADRRYNKYNLTLHDYFFVKALDQVREGGLVVGITASGTMDKVGKIARRQMEKRADLVAAFRMPAGAFQKYAGTKVVADVIILKKRAEGAAVNHDAAWLENTVLGKAADGKEIKVNEYWTHKPENVLGNMTIGHGTTQGREGMIVERKRGYEDVLSSLTERLPKNIVTKRGQIDHVNYITNNTTERQNSVTIKDNGLYIVRGERLARLDDTLKYSVKDEKKTAAREAELKSLVRIRERYGKLLDAERNGEKTAENHRTILNQLYKAFVKKYGNLNGSFALKHFVRAGDPMVPAMAALEKNTGTKENPVYEPAKIFTASTQRQKAEIKNPSISDAFVMTRNEVARVVDIEAIAEKAGTTPEAVKAELIKKDAVFETPAGTFEVKDIYLSGNVREKLREAKAAKEDGLDMDRNIKALEAVIPDDIPYFNIEANLGAAWIPSETYKQFITETANLPEDIAKGIHITPSNNGWIVKFDDAGRIDGRQEVKTIWATSRASFTKILKAAFTGQTITIKSKDEDGNEFVDQEASAAANEKVDAFREALKDWIWKDVDRRVALEQHYNETMNAWATPAYDGSFLSFDGMMLQMGESEFNLRKHQVNAIWRGVANGRGLYAHEVGTGKTFTMGGIAVESRRYGLAKKPLILGHNANSASVADDIQSMYPGAKVLYIDNLTPKTIDQKLYQIANDDWDAVVLPHSLLDRLTLSRETLDRLAQDEIMSLEEEAIASAADEGFDIEHILDDEDALKKIRGATTAKEMVKQRNRIIQNIEKQSQAASREGAIPFESLGVDMLIVDEVHEFKKPPLSTKMKVKGLNTTASGRSIGLNFLTSYVKEQNSGKGVHIFTGTPITNTLNEIYNHMRYVMSSEMEKADVLSWDSWFNTFASVESDIERTSSGDYEMVSRLSGFHNVSELRKFAGQYMDIVFAEDMPEFVPRKTKNGKDLHSKDLTDAERDELVNGRVDEGNPSGRPYKKLVNEVADMSEEQRGILQTLVDRAKSFKDASGKERKDIMQSGDPRNPVIIETDAAKAGFDPRLYDKELSDHPRNKINRCVTNVLKHYQEHEKASQVIFMDKGYNDQATRSRSDGAGGKAKFKVDTFNASKDLKNKLIEGGIPAEQIAIVNGSVAKKKRLEIANKVNSSEIRVVIGLTATLGTGTNMQENLRAMHHLDAPWMPGELEQRNGRGHRQGNRWNTVLEYRYITESIDARRWQVLAKKQKMITDFLKAKEGVRSIEGDAVDLVSSDLDEINSSFSEAAGDARILIREKLKKDIDKLEKKERTHGQGVVDAKNKIKDIEGRRLPNLKDRVKGLQSDMSHYQSVSKDPWSITIDGKKYTKRQKANVAFEKLSLKLSAQGLRLTEKKNIGTYRGFDIMVSGSVGIGNTYTLERDLSYPIKPATGSIDFLTRNFPSMLDNARKQVSEETNALDKFKQVAKEPFAQEEALKNKKESLDQLEQDLESNPDAPPSWLAQGAPVGTEVYYKGEPWEVDGHRKGEHGYYLIVKQGENQEVVDYREVMDENNMPVYEALEGDAVSGEAKFSISTDAKQNADTKTLDKKYFDAIQRGDMGTAQQLVNEAAEKSGAPIFEKTNETGFSIRRTSPPKKTVKVYKAFRMRDGKLYPMFVGAKDELPINQWMDATEGGYHFTADNGREYIPADTGVSIKIPNDEVRQELFKRGYIKKPTTKSIKSVAYRPGWHGGEVPFFPQAGNAVFNNKKKKLVPEVPDGYSYPNVHEFDTVIAEVEMDADYNYKQEYLDSAARNKDGSINKTLSGLRRIPKGGYYEYATNPLFKDRPELGKWYISGSVKINKILSQKEVNKRLAKIDVPQQLWNKSKDTEFNVLDLDRLGYDPQFNHLHHKLLDPVTYDDNGNPIPLSKRFDLTKTDPRYSSTSTIDKTPGQGITLDQIKSQYKNQQITTNPDGILSIRFTNGKGVRIKTVDHIGGDDIRFAMESGRMKRDGVILGKYQDGEITLNTNMADMETAIHENYHALKALGMITPADEKTLNNLTKMLKAQKKNRYDIQEDLEENQANTLAQLVADRANYREGSNAHALIQKIVDFFDALVHIGRQSARKLAREYESGAIYGREANGLSKGTPNFQIAGNTDSEAFKKWFDGSVAKTKSGEPVSFFHGSPNRFTVFEDRPGESTTHTASGLGHFFTMDRDYANSYAKDSGNVIEAYLQMKKPYKMSLDEAQSFETVTDSIIKKRKLRLRGYDSIIIPVPGASPLISVFSSGQVKSVANRGTWDGSNPDIRYQTSDDAKAPTESEKKKVYGQIASGLQHVIKNRKNKGPGYKKDIGVLENTMGLMSHYSESIPALKRTFEELLKRPEWKFQKENELSKNGEESMIGTMEDLQKHNKAAYSDLKEYLVDRDINQIGAVLIQDEDGTWTIKSPKDERTGKRSILEEGILTKNKARDLAIQYEVDEYPDPAARDALRAFRTVTANLHDFYAESWESIIEEYEERGLTLPEVVTRTKSGEVRVNLKVAIAKMGERSSYYFPRQRSNGDWRVHATKEGEHDFIEYRDTKVGADYLAGKLKAQGYTIKKYEVDGQLVEGPQKVGSLSEDLFQGVGNPLFVQSLVNQALSETKMDEKMRSLVDLGLKGEWRKDGFYIPNGGVYEWSSAALSELGGREYSERGKKGMSWSPGYWFENAPKDIEDIVTNALYLSRGHETDISFEFSQSLVKQLADTLRARGSRARMISRSDATGKDVPMGYETDPLKALAQAVNSAAGGYAKQQVAVNTSKAITGQHYTWNEWQKQHPDYDALQAVEESLKTMQKNSKTENERIDAIDQKIKELQRERIGVNTESEAARQDRLFRIGTLFREKEKIRKWENDDQAAAAHQELARLRGKIHKEYRQYIQDNMLDPKRQKRAYTDAVNAVENVLKNDEAADRVINTLKGLASVWFLGGRLSSAAINLTAMGTTVPAAMDAYGGVPLRKTATHIAKAGKSYASFVTGKGTVSNADRAILEEIFSRGWVAAQLNMETVNALKSGPAQKYGRAVELLMTPFKITEEFNRGTTLLAAYKGIMSENPGMSKEDALSKAKTVSDRAHGIYGVENQPALLRKGRGLRAASAMYIFQTFMHNYMTTLSYMIGRRQAAAFTYMILSPMIFGGAASSLALPVVQMMFRAMGEDDPEEKIYQVAEGMFGESGGDIARYGLPGLAGVSLKGSLAPGLPDFKEPLDVLGPIGGMMRNIYQGGVNITQGNYLKGVEKITPLAMGNIAKAYRETSEGITTRAGDQVFFGNEQVQGDLGTGIMRAAGLNPTKIAKPREIQWNETKLKRQYAEKKRRIYSRIVRYHAQPVSKKSFHEWQDIMTDIKEFNARVKSNGLGRVVPKITAKTIKSRVRRAFRPSKRERERTEQ